jgi:hypothetical protein
MGMFQLSDKSKWLIAASVFAVSVGPTLVSYQPYVFRWDDSGYLGQCIAVSRAFWWGSAHGVAHLREIMAATNSIRPPMMTLLGLPWGQLTSWDAAGKCFLTLAVLQSFFASLCLFLLARIGLKPIFLVLASICAFASFGPLPQGATSHHLATAFLADGLFAWIALAALLLIPYESRTHNRSIKHAFLRGVLWGVTLSAGAMTKISFFYFVSLIAPVLLVIRLRHGGRRGMLAAIIGLACATAPAAAYLVKYGRASFVNGGESSFGGVANFYSVPLFQFLIDSLRHSPGIAVFVTYSAASLGYLLIRRRALVREPDFLALLIASGFGMIVMASVNREIRFSFPAILALPFLLGVLLSAKGAPVPRISAVLASCLVFCGLTGAAFPTRHRAERQASLGRSDAVILQATKCDDKNILLATDSPTLNQELLGVAVSISRSTSPIEFDSLAYRSMSGLPIGSDYRVMQNSDLIVFQDDQELSPQFTNVRVPEYKRFISEHDEYVPFEVGDDVTAYSRYCRP